MTKLIPFFVDPKANVNIIPLVIIIIVSKLSVTFPPSLPLPLIQTLRQSLQLRGPR